MHGDELLSALSELPKDAPAAALMRHAARYPIANSAQPTLAEITPEGAAAAEAMGKQLRDFDCIRLFHSPVKRCQQTAECLAKGVRAAGLDVQHVGPEAALGVDYILDLPEAGRLTDLHGEHFVRLWMEGKIPEPVVRATRHIMELKLRYLAPKLADPCSAGRRLDLHVTHDWNILVLRELTLGLRHEELGWLTYLDGLAFSPRPNGLLAVYRQHQRQLELDAS